MEGSRRNGEGQIRTIRSLALQCFYRVLDRCSDRVKSDRQRAKQRTSCERGQKSHKSHLCSIGKFAEPQSCEIPRGGYRQQIGDDQKEHKFLREDLHNVIERRPENLSNSDFLFSQLRGIRDEPNNTE